MGGGSWSTKAYCTYACSAGRGYDNATNTITINYTDASQAYTQCNLHESLDVKNKIRECRDSDEHPETIPVILALDVTGSMGDTAIKVQKHLSPIMTELFESVKDVEFAVMGIGDLAYDRCPIQMSQFESDIRIAENLDKIYFERGGGGNEYESYTAAWYTALHNTNLDCHKRGRKGLIITMGDEPLNPYLPMQPLNESIGSAVQANVETKELYEEASKKFDIYHICVKSRSYPDQDYEKKSFAKVLGDQHVMISSVEDIHKTIVDIVKAHAAQNESFIETVPGAAPSNIGKDGLISW